MHLSKIHLNLPGVNELKCFNSLWSSDGYLHLGSFVNNRLENDLSPGQYLSTV